jgi:transcriptional regulator with XRE-family HTH domain
MNPLAVFVGERIKARRVELGLSLADVAAKLKIGRQNIHRYETGARLPTLEALYPLAAALDCDVSDLTPSQAEGVKLVRAGAQLPDDAPAADREVTGQG